MEQTKEKTFEFPFLKALLILLSGYGAARGKMNQIPSPKNCILVQKTDYWKPLCEAEQFKKELADKKEQLIAFGNKKDCVEKKLSVLENVFVYISTLVQGSLKDSEFTNSMDSCYDDAMNTLKTIIGPVSAVNWKDSSPA